MSVKLDMMLGYHENGRPQMKISQGELPKEKNEVRNKVTLTASPFPFICVPMHPTCIQFVVGRTHMAMFGLTC